MTDKQLIEKAIKAMENSYSPYSGFRVGAALLTARGDVYTGCNIENASFSATVCAERTAFFNAISNGEDEFTKIAVVGSLYSETTEYCYPCGVCRQVMSEFCGDGFKILLFNGKDIKECTLGELLPHSFGRDDLCE